MASAAKTAKLWDLGRRACALGAALAAIGAAHAGQPQRFGDGKFNSAVVAFKDETGKMVKARETLEIKGDSVKIDMLAWRGEQEPEKQVPVLSWTGQVEDRSGPLLAVKRDRGADRRFFRLRADGVVEELARKKEFAAAP